MKILKRISSAFTVSAILLGNISSMTSNASDSYTFQYSIIDNKVSISGCTGTGSSITIPDTIENLPVTSIQNGAFQQCGSAESIYIGKSVESIADGAFSACTSLDKIEVSPENQFFCSVDNSLFNKNKDTLIRYAGESSEAVIPDGTKNIGNYAFFCITDIVSVSIPQSVVSIGNYSFTYCESLQSVSLPDSVTSIGKESFMNCTSLKTAYIGKGVSVIPEGCFSLCSNLNDVIFFDSITSISDEAFYSCPLLTEMYIPKSVTEIGANAVGINYDMRTDTNYPVTDFILLGFKDSVSESYSSQNQLDFTDMSQAISGDTNLDGVVNASDASETLSEYALTSTGFNSTFSKMQFICSDYNNDGLINSSDASEILAKYAEISSGK